MRNIRTAVDSTLDHYEYVLVGGKGEEKDNIIIMQGFTPAQIYRYLIIVYGADRISKTKGKVRVNHE